MDVDGGIVGHKETVTRALGSILGDTEGTADGTVEGTALIVGACVHFPRYAV